LSTTAIIWNQAELLQNTNYRMSLSSKAFSLINYAIKFTTDIWLKITGISDNLIKFNSPVRVPPDTVGNILDLSTGFVLFTDENEVFEFDIIEEDIFKITALMRDITGKPSEFTARISPDEEYNFKVGEWEIFLDGFNNIIFIGKVVNPRNLTTRSATLVTYYSFDYDLYNKLYVDDTDVSSGFLRSLLALSVYMRESSLGSDDTTLSYTREIKSKFNRFVDFVRELERVVFVKYPNGDLLWRELDNLESNPVRFTHEHPQVRLLSYEPMDMAITRSEAVGAHNAKGQVRVEYIGDRAQEYSEGVTKIFKQDISIRNHEECYQFAVNRYDIYTLGENITFWAKLRVEGQGMLLPGTTIILFWDDNYVKIPYGEYIITEVNPHDIKNGIQEITVSNNIVTQNEFRTVQRSIKEDENINVTYYDPFEKSIVNTGIMKQQTVSEVIAAPPDGRGPKTVIRAVSPTVLEDEDFGIKVGDLWLNTATAKLYVCSDNTAGAAVWNILN